jgi:uncharacterized integral membrane protein
MTTGWDVERAVAAAFRTPEEGEKYVDRLLACCKDTASAIRRLLILLILCMAVFELLNRAAVDTISISFVELKDPTVVVTFLPVVVGYLQYQLVARLLQWRSLERVCAAVLAVVQPGVSAGGLGGFVVPGVPLFATRLPRGALYERIFTLQQRAEALFAAVGSLLLPGFQVYAFSQLLNRPGSGGNVLTWAALVLTAVLTAAYLVTIGILFAQVVHWRAYHYFWAEGAPGRSRWESLCRRFRSPGP